MSPILIIGGGIGGLTAALALARAGFPAHVVEQSAQFGEIGAGIQLAPNALRVLDRLGVRDELMATAVRPTKLLFMNADTGRHLTTIEFGAAFERHYGQPYLVMHRGDLLNVLYKACLAESGVVLESGRAVVGVADLGSRGRVRVRIADGSSSDFGCVVGADGLRSVTRRLLSDDEPVPDHFVAYRGTLPSLPAGRPAGAGPDDEVIWIGTHKHFVQYPIRPGELYNHVAVFRSERFTGIDDESWGSPEELDAAFAGCCAAVRAAVALVRRDRRWVMCDREPLDNWTSGRITLLGDAAHPMVQYLAQGACQAIEDADCLARMFAAEGSAAEGDAAGGAVDRALRAYQAERLPRSALVQRVARNWGTIWHDDGPVIPVLRDRIFTRRRPDDYSDMDWLYG